MSAQQTPAPPGFDLSAPDVIRYRTAGTGRLRYWVLTWLAGWLVACVLLTRWAVVGSEPAVAWFLAAVFWAGAILVAGWTLWYFWTTTVLQFDPDRLVVERSLLGRRWKRVVERQNVRSVRQVREAVPEEYYDEPTGWGLVVVADKTVKVLTRQLRSQSDWLGPVIARWADVPFEAGPPPRTS